MYILCTAGSAGVARPAGALVRGGTDAAVLAPLAARKVPAVRAAEKKESEIVVDRWINR